MTKTVDVAIVGATGAVGEAIVELLEQREFPVGTLYLLASERTAGTSTMFRKKPVRVGKLFDFDFSLAQIVIFVANDQVAQESIPQALAAGCYVLDNSRVFVEDSDVPLVIPSVNGDLLEGKNYRHIANPDSATILLWSVLKPVLDSVGIESINVTTQQAVSGPGRRAISELAAQTASLLNMKGAKSEIFAKQIAFNILPAVGAIDEEGLCLSERHLLNQSAKIIDNVPPISVTTLQVPVFYGDSLAISLRTEEPIDASEFETILKKQTSIKVLPNHGEKALLTAVTEVAGDNRIWVSRVRNDPSHGRGINLWVIGDNVRIGAAINTIELAELLLKSYL